MVTANQDIVVITVTVFLSLLALTVVNRIWPATERTRYNDLIGWQLSILGTTYAVILGFMLYTVWTSFGEADRNVDLEANAVIVLYRLAYGLPEPQRTKLQSLARSYVNTVIEVDWPQMAKGKLPEQTTEINKEMWKTVMSVNPTSPTEVNAQERAMSELESLAQSRLTRVLQSKLRLPNVLWWVLLVGGGLTIISACIFGTPNVKLQIVQVFCLSLLVSLTLVAISNIHRPFHGLVHVSDYAFQRARQVMQSP